MKTGTKSKLLALSMTALVLGCSTTTEFGQEDLGGAMRAHVERDRALFRAVKDRVRADHAAIKAAFRDAFGRRGTVVERSYAEPASVSHRHDRGLEPAPAVTTPYRDPNGRAAGTVDMKSVEMDVALAEMLTSEGMLHPRAASALSTMNAMARESGGDFSIAVPRSQLHTVREIQAVAPGATIVATDAKHYRLIVVAPDR